MEMLVFTTNIEHIANTANVYIYIYKTQQESCTFQKVLILKTYI